MLAAVDSLLARYPIISDQVDSSDLQIILTSLENVLERSVPGNVVEFGCYIGTTSLFISRLLSIHGEERKFHVYDSFEGLPLKSRQDESAAGTNFQAGSLTISKKQFTREYQKASLQLPIIHKGWFNMLTPDDVPNPIAFAFLDGDFYESIKASLKLVLPVMSRGGTVIIHDYAREALPGVARAAQQYSLKPKVIHSLGIVTV